MNSFVKGLRILLYIQHYGIYFLTASGALSSLFAL